MRRRLASGLALLVSVPVVLSARGGLASASAPFGEAPTAHSRLGAIASATPEATAAGAAVLAAGGNAVDAAVTTAFALAVTYPPAGDLARDPAASVLFAPGGVPLAAGALLVQEDLARTLETIAAQGADGFHRGAVARRVAAFVQATGGVLTEEDLAGYRPEWRAPFVFDDGRFRLVTMPLPSSGGFLLASILGQLRFVRGAIDDRDAPETLHLVAEAERRAYAHRNRFLGDPACVDVPLAALLAPARLAALGFSIDPARVTPSSSIVGGAWPREPDQTTHYVRATGDGGAGAVTYTLNDTLGNRTVVPAVAVT